jgi:hypothetical protein
MCWHRVSLLVGFVAWTMAACGGGGTSDGAHAQAGASAAGTSAGTTSNGGGATGNAGASGGSAAGKGGANPAGSSGASGAGTSGSAGVAGNSATGLPLDDTYRGGFCAQGWCWSQPLPQGNYIDDLWSAVGAGVWVGARSGVVLHWNGASWDRLAISGGLISPVIWGSGPNDVYITNGTDLHHWDGTKLALIALPTAITALPMIFQDLSGTGPNDVWAATTHGAAHFDGSTWSAFNGVPNVPLSYVQAAAPNRIWFTGGAIGSGALLLWDGQAFRTISTDPADGSREWAVEQRS